MASDATSDATNFHQTSDAAKHPHLAKVCRDETTGWWVLHFYPDTCHQEYEGLWQFPDGHYFGRVRFIDGQRETVKKLWVKKTPNGSVLAENDPLLPEVITVDSDCTILQKLDMAQGEGIVVYFDQATQKLCAPYFDGYKLEFDVPLTPHRLETFNRHSKDPRIIGYVLYPDFKDAENLIIRLTKKIPEGKHRDKVTFNGKTMWFTEPKRHVCNETIAKRYCEAIYTDDCSDCGGKTYHKGWMPHDPGELRCGDRDGFFEYNGSEWEPP